ncbi:hypothetical protein OROHE_001132 [Orobanche hederae]
MSVSRVLKENNKSIPNDWNVQGYGEEFIKRYGVYPE